MTTNSPTAEDRLAELGIKLPAPPEPFGIYVEAVQTGDLLFLTGMLPTEGRSAKFIGRVGAELDVEAGRKAAHLAALNVLAVARQHRRPWAQPEGGRLPQTNVALGDVDDRRVFGVESCVGEIAGILRLPD